MHIDTLVLITNLLLSMKKSLLLVVALSLSLCSLFAQSGKYIEFNGTNQYMQIPTHADFNVTSSESFTITAWVNVLEFKNNNARFITKRLQSTTLADKSGYELWGANSAANYYALNTPNAAGNHNNSFSVWATYTGSANKWTHIAFVVDRAAGKMYQYIDGVEVANSGTKDISPWAVNNAWDVYVGCGISGSTTAAPAAGQYFRGQMDNLRFWKKALSPADIIADKTAAVTSETAGLVAAYDFENITNFTVPDIKGNHPGTIYNFPVPGDVKISSATVTQDKNFSGRGNDNEEILKLTLNTTGTTEADITSLVLNMNGTTDINEVETIKIYTTKGTNRFDPRNPGVGTLLGTATPADGTITVSTTGKLLAGTNYLWITYKVKETAKEGNKLDASVASITTNFETYTFTSGDPAGSRTILLRRTLVYGPGDYNSTNYRIPAITTAADGSLVVLTDKRKFHSGDLAANIDVVANRSTDGGKTWSAPVTVALGTSTSNGFGDAAIIKTNSGKLVTLFVGGPGFFSSTASAPIRSYMSTSSDNGVTWSTPRDITSQIYGAGCTNPVRAAWLGSFFGSGHQLTLRNGRLMAVIAVREPGLGSSLQNYAVYSDDEGETWNVSNKALSGGDEAKVVELNDGTILMSVRTGGNRLWTKSTDGGVTWGAKNSWSEIWGNACDADIVRYTSTKDGYDKNRILHTLPNASDRTNVTMWVSYDEGTTWPVKRSIAAGESAYSSVTILPDGTIGVYLEEDGSIPYKMYFLNYSLDWLTNGADSFTPAGTEIVAQPEISLAPGRYSPPQTVTLTTSTTGASIYYTLDGATPNKNSTLYTGAIVLENSCTLKAIAMKDGMANSIISSANYTIGYLVPGQNRATIAERYVTAATTTGANTNINFTASAPPASHYLYYNTEAVTMEKGKSFTLNLTSLPGQTDGMQWCQAIILADWNKDYDFADAGERIAIIGARTTDNGTTLLNISQSITVPANAASGKIRLRVVYTDSWRPTAYADLGEDPVDKGRMYDFDLVITSTSGVENALAQQLSAFPNPTRGMLSVNLPVSGKYSVTLLSLDGKTIETKNIVHADASTYSMDISSYPSAAYLLKVKHESGFEKSIRILKQGK